ncbi:MAG: ribonuclease HI family protein [Clostridia bacterium]|nr:ribonuclease HI family protein [Clostridia bacterium]
MKLVIYTDGAARGNPGPAGIGVVIQNDKGEVIQEISGFLGQATNNVAEYTALTTALEKAVALNAQEVQLFTDSELIVKQIKGEYRVKNEGLKPLYQKAKGLIQQLGSFTITHVPREKNKEADRLANQGIDEEG